MIGREMRLMIDIDVGNPGPLQLAVGLVNHAWIIEELMMMSLIQVINTKIGILPDFDSQKAQFGERFS